MKVIAIILMLITFLLAIGYGMFYLLGFAMSFDAPGSDKDAGAWLMRVVMFSPVIICLVMLLLSFLSFRSDNHKRSVVLGSVAPVLFIGVSVYLMADTAKYMKTYNATVAQESQDALDYPLQKFIRPVEGGTDTILVFPNRIVAYRLYTGTENTFGGPLGDLNSQRDTFLFYDHFDTRLTRDDLEQFEDADGRKFNEVYAVR
jgi:hypothetical protein